MARNTIEAALGKSTNWKKAQDIIGFINNFYKNFE